MGAVVKRFWKDNKGSVATSIGVLAVPLMLCCGVAVDYVILGQARSSLQEAADAAALASAKELAIANAKDSVIEGVAHDYALSSLHSTFGSKQDIHSTSVKTSISRSRQDVTVEISHVWKPMIIQYIDSTALPIEVNSTATLAGEQSICVLALEENNDQAIDMGGNDGHITANNCAVFSNSSGARGIAVFKQSTLTGSSIFTAGGYDGSPASFSPSPITDTPKIADPLLSRQPPSIGACDHNRIAIKKSETLKPGVYCGGLDVSGKAVATLLPGDYIIKDGPLSIRGNASIIGEDVGFYLTGNNATFDFGVSTQAVLSARESGPLAGMLFFEDRNSPYNRNFTIRSKDAEKFEGTIYLPKGRLWVDKASKVGQKSAWTAIIAHRIAIGSGPDIVINADYASSSIPVPEGIGSGQDIRLKR